MKKLWKCNVCGYIHEGEQAPDACPKCGAPKEKFSALSSMDAEKIFEADRTNTIHMEIVAEVDELTALCHEGIELKLDPPCVSLFEKAIAEFKVIKQRCKAEIETHVNKAKW